MYLSNLAAIIKTESDSRIVVSAETGGQSSTFAYYDSSNLLKFGASFPFYGKGHNRVGLWPYGLTNVEGNKSAAGFCLEPNKSQRSGATGSVVAYDLPEGWTFQILAW